MTLQETIAHVCQSVARAEAQKSCVSDAVLSIDGMSSPRIRHLLNNLCNFDGCRYLEVGSWKGSTLCSALKNNRLDRACAYENFAEFTDNDHRQGATIRDQLLQNIEAHRGNNTVELVEKDFFESPPAASDRPFNIYLYDGQHTKETQYFQVERVKKSLNTISVMVVDDWFCSVSTPKDMTFRALHDFGFYIHQFIELPSGFETGYWGGQGLFIVEKK